MKIEMRSEGPKGTWTVVVDDLFADHLAPDEALGVVAAALFSGSPKKHPFLRSYESWLWFEKRYRNYSRPVTALLSGPTLEG